MHTFISSAIRLSQCILNWSSVLPSWPLSQSCWHKFLMALSEKHIAKKNTLLVADGIANNHTCSHLLFFGSGTIGWLRRVLHKWHIGWQGWRGHGGLLHHCWCWDTLLMHTCCHWCLCLVCMYVYQHWDYCVQIWVRGGRLCCHWFRTACRHAWSVVQAFVHIIITFNIVSLRLVSEANKTYCNRSTMSKGIIGCDNVNADDSIW